MPPTRSSSSAFLRTANRVLIPLLGSPLGAHLGCRLAVIDYVGHRSGQRHRLVTQYLLDGQTFRINVGMPERKTWWRNFASDRPLRVRLAGHDHVATAHVVRDGERVLVVGEIATIEKSRPLPGSPRPRERSTSSQAPAVAHGRSERGTRSTPANWENGT